MVRLTGEKLPSFSRGLQGVDEAVVLKACEAKSNVMRILVGAKRESSHVLKATQCQKLLGTSYEIETLSEGLLNNLNGLVRAVMCANAATRASRFLNEW